MILWHEDCLQNLETIVSTWLPDTQVIHSPHTWLSLITPSCRHGWGIPSDQAWAGNAFLADWDGNLKLECGFWGETVIHNGYILKHFSLFWVKGIHVFNKLFLNLNLNISVFVNCTCAHTNTWCVLLLWHSNISILLQQFVYQLLPLETKHFSSQELASKTLLPWA